MPELELSWLPELPKWAAHAKELELGAPAWGDVVAIANTRMDFLKTDRLDKIIVKAFGDEPPPGVVSRPVRLALLGSSTLQHLRAGIRVAAARRGLWVSIYEADYGQYLQDLLDSRSPLYAFRPDVVLLSLDAHHLFGGTPADGSEVERALTRLEQCWDLIRDNLGATVIQQTVMPVFPSLLGGSEHCLATSPARAVTAINGALRTRAEPHGLCLLALDERAAQDGVRAWHDPRLWFRAKQEVSPVAGPLYGDLVARILAALQGRSFKCLALDLDNTIWGGVVGDDGVEGLTLGQGSALGEAYLAVQAHALALAGRGVILAVCSKNDEANAYAAFDRHPEMILRREHIAAFAVNWDDKATNLRRVAQQLNIGLDSIVFLDDNPFERNLVRQEIPAVAVPEFPDDEPALVPRMLSDSGYFESVGITDDDLARTAMYQKNQARAALQSSVTDLPTYLRSLEMELEWRRFDRLGLARTTQLINKTNQFNLRTRRYTEQEVGKVQDDPRAFGLQLRLKDRFGDNGVIAVVIGRLEGDGDCMIDTWLMSCRVLGRNVEEATLNVVAERARHLGATRLVGEYIPTAKNQMVADLYDRLGFDRLEARADGSRLFALSLAEYSHRDAIMRVVEGE